jgi:benzoyl-CoA reductase subunit C
MRKVYELRKRDNLPISGTEAMEIVMSSQVMDKEEHNLLLEQLLEEISQIGGKYNSRARVMLVGQTDDVELVRFIESLGFTVVIDDLCFGTRYFWNEVTTEDDRLFAIASRYLDKPPCPLRDIQVERRRPSHILSLAQEYRAQSVILVRPAFCDPHGYDMPVIEEFLQQNNMPCLRLDTDVTTPVEQFRTRIEAHLETVSEIV